MAKSPPSFGTFFGEAFLCGYSVWRRSDEMSNPALAAIQVAASLAAALLTWGALGYSKPDFTYALAIFILTWLVVAFAIMGPYLAWKAQRKRADALEARLESQLEVGFEDDADGICYTKFQGSTRSAFYIRGHVKPTSSARVTDCRAAITEVSLKYHDENEWHVITRAQLPCKWASSTASEALTLAPGTTSFFDVAIFDPGDGTTRNRAFGPASLVTPLGIADTFGERASYRFTVVVDAHETKAETIVLEVDPPHKLADKIKAKRVR